MRGEKGGGRIYNYKIDMQDQTMVFVSNLRGTSPSWSAAIDIYQRLSILLN